MTLNKDQFGPLFHGSDHEFAPGDVIEPKTKSYAHATPDLRTARVFGEHVYEVEPINTDETWTRTMKYMKRGVHFETLGPGFRVKDGPIPKNRKQSAYEDRPGSALYHNVDRGWSYDDENGWRNKYNDS